MGSPFFPAAFPLQFHTSVPSLPCLLYVAAHLIRLYSKTLIWRIVGPHFTKISLTFHPRRSPTTLLSILFSKYEYILFIIWQTKFLTCMESINVLEESVHINLYFLSKCKELVFKANSLKRRYVTASA